MSAAALRLPFMGQGSVNIGCVKETMNPLVSLAYVYWRFPAEIYCFLQPVNAVNLNKFPRKCSSPSVEEWDQDAQRLNEKPIHTTFLSWKFAVLLAYWKHWDVCLKMTLLNPTFPKLIWAQNPICFAPPWNCKYPAELWPVWEREVGIESSNVE